jgi:ribosomal protein L12E/L44/L45/RPP1/RPP2
VREREVDERDVALEAAIREFNHLQARPGASVSRSVTTGERAKKREREKREKKEESERERERVSSIWYI